MEWDEIIGTTPYKKSKGGSKSKSSKKSKHKHTYLPCLIKYNWASYPNLSGSYHTGKYCSICGKLQEGNSMLPITEKTDKNFYRLLSTEEILNKYSDLPIKELTI